MEGDRFYGVVTDRDVVVRAIAEEQDPSSAKIRDIVTEGTQTLAPSSTVDDAVAMMRHARSVGSRSSMVTGPSASCR
jgi:CBS domain-containing protein